MADRFSTVSTTVYNATSLFFVETFGKIVPLSSIFLSNFQLSLQPSQLHVVISIPIVYIILFEAKTTRRRGIMGAKRGRYGKFVTIGGTA